MRGIDVVQECLDSPFLPPPSEAHCGMDARRVVSVVLLPRREHEPLQDPPASRIADGAQGLRAGPLDGRVLSGIQEQCAEGIDCARVSQFSQGVDRGEANARILFMQTGEDVTAVGSRGSRQGPDRDDEEGRVAHGGVPDDGGQG